MLLRLIYTSKAVPPLEFDQLLLEARRSNDRSDITGGLAMLNGVFLQYLEGEEDTVFALVARLRKDARHTDLKILEQRHITRRMFAGWEMALLEWTKETEMIFQSFSPGKPLNLYETDSDTAAPLFRKWASTASWKSSRAAQRDVATPLPTSAH